MTYEPEEVTIYLSILVKIKPIGLVIKDFQNSLFCRQNEWKKVSQKYNSAMVSNMGQYGRVRTIKSLREKFTKLKKTTKPT